MYIVELKIPPSICFAACVCSYLFTFASVARAVTASQNGAGCAFKTATLNLWLGCHDVFTLTCPIQDG